MPLGAFGGVALDGGGGHLHAAAALPRKELLVPIGWSPDRGLMLWSGENTRTGTGNKTMIPRLSNPLL
jgi:hypothetical protein